MGKIILVLIFCMFALSSCKKEEKTEENVIKETPVQEPVKKEVVSEKEVPEEKAPVVQKEIGITIEEKLFRELFDYGARFDFKNIEPQSIKSEEVEQFDIHSGEDTTYIVTHITRTYKGGIFITEEDQLTVFEEVWENDFINIPEMKFKIGDSVETVFTALGIDVVIPDNLERAVHMDNYGELVFVFKEGKLERIIWAYLPG